MPIDPKMRQTHLLRVYSPSHSYTMPTSSLWLADNRRYSVMASDLAGSNQVGGIKRFRHVGQS